MINYGKDVTQFHQTEKARKDQVKNDAGGYVFESDTFQKIRSFLIIGTEGGTYYVDQKKATLRSFDALTTGLTENPSKVIDLILEVSLEGLALKQDQTLFCLAVAASFNSEIEGKEEQDLNTRRAAFKAVQDVCRTPTHLFMFLNYLKTFRSLSSYAVEKTVKEWYLNKPVDQLAYHMTKYRNREGFTHRDVLRLAHVETTEVARNALFRWATSHDFNKRELEWEGRKRTYDQIDVDQLPESVKIFEEVQKCTKMTPALKEYLQSGLVTHEMLPNELLKVPAVWEQLIPKMPLTALIRNLGRMTANGVLRSNTQDLVQVVCDNLLNETLLKRARIHPIQCWIACNMYDRGHGGRGSLSWEPVSNIVEALNQAFYKSFKTVKPTGKRYLLALDVSGSMTVPLSNIPYLSAMGASAAMLLATKNIERKTDCVVFSDNLTPFKVNRNTGLENLKKELRSFRFSRTDCSLPMLYALKERLEYDVFVVYTDSETYWGSIHPYKALQNYRKEMGIDAKLVVVGCDSSGFTIADPKDPGMLDVVGFSGDVPQVIASM